MSGLINDRLDTEDLISKEEVPFNSMLRSWLFSIHVMKKEVALAVNQCRIPRADDPCQA